ncbi:hypothetical protein BKA64DRAFT_726515 [Cadophora sp. MPI-SDFR-AT-0126]|nr:hypothetical protein BKA64DRAFT_726515 [Leotiomycetes sp. MPI-SDFR-AT-0126]
MSLPGLPLELTAMVLTYKDITPRDRSALGRVDKSLNAKNLEHFSRTLIEIPRLAGIIRSVAIHSDTDRDVAEQSQNMLGLVSKLQSVRFLGRWQNSLTLDNYLTFGGQPSNSALVELTLSSFEITRTQVLAILQLPQLRKSSVRSILSPSSPLSSNDFQLENPNASSPSPLEHLELGPFFKHDTFAEYLLKRCRSLKSLYLLVRNPEIEGADKNAVSLSRLLAPLAQTLESLKLRYSTLNGPEPNHDEHFPYCSSLRLKFSELKNLRSLDVVKGFLFLSATDADWDNIEIDTRDGLYLQLPRTLEHLKIAFPKNSSVVDHTFAWQVEQHINENFTWIEELASYKSEYLPNLQNVKLCEQCYVRKNKPWNTPRRINEIYQRNGIKLDVSARPLSTYQSDTKFTLAEVELASSQDDRMRIALEAYSLKMRESNQKFLTDRIEEIKSLKLPTKGNEIDRMARFWVEGYPCAEWPRPNYRSTQLATVTTSEKYKALWSLDDAVKSIDDDTSTKRAGLGEDGPLRMNDEFLSFVKYAPRGVQDADFCKSEICGFYPAWCLNDKYKNDYQWDFDTDTDGKWSFYAGGQSFQALVQLKAGKTRVHWNKAERARSGLIWTSYYIFCTKKGPNSHAIQASREQEMYTEANGWRWRVLIHDGWWDQSRDDCSLYLFNSIIGFLEWYGSWYDRLDLREVRENTEPLSQRFHD